MNRADSGAGQHGKGRLWDHGHVKAHAIAFFDPKVPQHIGKSADLSLEFLIRKSLTLVGLVTLPDNSSLICSVGQVSVNTVHRNIELCIDKPTRLPNLEVIV